MSLRNYEESEKYLKRTLKDIKDSNQEKSEIYMVVLSKLAQCNLKTNRFSESEKYYLICKDMIKDVPNITDKGYAHYNALLHYYFYTDLDKAEKFIEEMMAIDFQASSIRNIRFSFANFNLLKRNYDEAMSNYQKVLKMIPDDQLKAYTLNNMAVTGMYKFDRQIRNNEIAEDSQENNLSIVSTFKESLKLLENLPQFKVAKSKEESKFKDDYFQELFDLEHIIPPDYNHETEKHYLGLVENKDSGKVFTNISEYLLTHEKHNPNNISFWFKVGLDFYESKAPELIDRHLLLLALFYSANQKITTAETIYKSVLTKMKKDDCYQKALGLNMYGRMLLKHPKRKEQGMVYIQQSEEIMSILPHWYDKIDNIFLLNED